MVKETKIGIITAKNKKLGRKKWAYSLKKRKYTLKYWKTQKISRRALSNWKIVKVKDQRNSASQICLPTNRIKISKISSFTELGVEKEET